MESIFLTKKRLMIALTTLLLSVGGYYWNKRSSLEHHYEMEYYFAYAYHNGDKFKRELKRITADMRLDGFNGKEIQFIEHKGMRRWINS